MLSNMFPRFQNKMRPIILEMNKNRYSAFLGSVAFTTSTGAVIGSSVGLYNGYQLSRYHVSITDKLKMTLGGCFHGFVQGCVYCCYPLYPLYLMRAVAPLLPASSRLSTVAPLPPSSGLMVYSMEEYNKEKRIYYIR
jgi:hypothetical protein